MTTPLPAAGRQEVMIPSSNGKDNTTNKAAPRRDSLKPLRMPPRKSNTFIVFFKQGLYNVYFIGCHCVIIHRKRIE